METFCVSAIQAPSNLTQRIWQRFIDSADSDADSTLSAEELRSFNIGAETDRTFGQLIAGLDANGDGAIGADEVTARPYQAQTTRAPIDIQEWVQTSVEQREAVNREDVAKLFERADVDGDGLLSREEWEAEKAMVKTRFLEGESEADSVAYAIFHKVGDWDYLAPEDFRAMRRLTGLEPMDPETMPEDLKERMAEIRVTMERLKESPDYQAPPNRKERNARLQAEVLNTPFSEAYVSRLFSQLVRTVSETDPAGSLNITS